MSAFRSFLFTPGNHPRQVAKVFNAGADAAILDLEDAVAIAEKPATRAAIVEALDRPRACLGYVRVNAYDTQFCFRDITAVVCPALDGIVLPKVESPDQVQSIDWLLAHLEREQGLAPGSIDLMPIIETGKGVSNVAAIASCGSRLRRLSFGAGDYTLDMNMIWSDDERELEHARAAIALASRAAGLEPPVDTVFIHIGEQHRAALTASARRAQGMGFQGKLCIHPEQIGPVNEVFTPGEAAVVHARKVITAFDEAQAAGSASIQVEGYFVDYPIVEKARRLIALMERIRAQQR
ncbi:MAG: CoA ester lyase [Gammaproteobacteria bacterium]|nr:CoA ester lyase [Gammaproteobacteria bacterium]